MRTIGPSIPEANRVNDGIGAREMPVEGQARPQVVWQRWPSSRAASRAGSSAVPTASPSIPTTSHTGTGRGCSAALGFATSGSTICVTRTRASY